MEPSLFGQISLFFIIIDRQPIVRMFRWNLQKNSIGEIQVKMYMQFIVSDSFTTCEKTVNGSHARSSNDGYYLFWPLEFGHDSAAGAYLGWSFTKLMKTLPTK